MGFGDVSRDTVVQAVIRLKEDQPPGETCGDFLDRLTAMIGVDMQPHRKSPGARKAYSMLYHMADLAYYTPEFRDGGLTESDIELAKRSQSMQQFVQGLSNEEHVRRRAMANVCSFCGQRGHYESDFLGRCAVGARCTYERPDGTRLEGVVQKVFFAQGTFVIVEDGTHEELTCAPTLPKHDVPLP